MLVLTADLALDNLSLGLLILSNPLEANESFVFTIGFGKYKENYDKDI